MSDNINSIISDCYNSVRKQPLLDEPDRIACALSGMRGLFDQIIDQPEKMFTQLFSSELDSEVLYYPVDIIELRKIFSHGYLDDRNGVALFSYRVAKKWLSDYPVLFGLRVDKKDLSDYGGFGIFKYQKLSLSDSLERLVISSDKTDPEIIESINKIVKDESVKADLINVNEPIGLSGTVVANTETIFKLNTTSIGLGPDSGLETNGYGYEGGISQVEEHKKYVNPTLVPSRYKEGDKVQIRAKGISDDPHSTGDVVSVKDGKVTIKWNDGKYKGKSHTLPVDSVLLDKYVQII